MKIIRSVWIASFLFLAGIMFQLQVVASIRLPALIGNNMVLQQNTTINVWGWADAGEKVIVQASWQTSPIMTTATSDGKWKTILNTPKAGGPFKMTISGRDYSITIENVMIGEVWICSGQSNMDFSIRGLGGWRNYKPEVRNEVAAGKFASVRMFTVKKDTSALLLDNCKGNWLTADTNTVNDFSATAWFYGAYLNEQLSVPVGLIATAWGGTPAEVWTPVESIQANADLGFYLNHYNGTKWWPGTSGVLYNAMINPLINYTIKGAIWYQGESNRMDAKLYPELMKTMIASWRKAWNLGDFPFYYVQIAPFTYDEPYSGSLLREAQFKCLSIPNTGMAVTMDLVDNIRDIHPKNKLDVGKRLALWALAKTYNKAEGSFSGPVYSEMKVSGNKAILSFLYADSQLKVLESAGNNFTIAGSDHVFYPANLKVMGDKLMAFSKKVSQPYAVRYAFTNTSEASLFNKAGLPASSFRTDDWDVINQKVEISAVTDPETHTLSYYLTSKARETDIYYDYNKVPGKNSSRYLSPLPAGKSGTLYAILSRNGYFTEPFSSWKIVANKASVARLSSGSDKPEMSLPANKMALIDGMIGSQDSQDKTWVGFEGHDLDVVIDLGKLIEVRKIKANFLSDYNRWVFMPKKVLAEVSVDGISFRKIGETEFENNQEVKAAAVRQLEYPCKGKVRFVKFKATNQGICPPWHPGAGNKAWFFMDEIVVE